jgi:hypothetical protein
METDRVRKRDSARKKSDFSVYSQKAVRVKERLQRAKPVVVQQKSSVVKVKNAMEQKPHLKTKNDS